MPVCSGQPVILSPEGLPVILVRIPSTPNSTSNQSLPADQLCGLCSMTLKQRRLMNRKSQSSSHDGKDHMDALLQFTNNTSKSSSVNSSPFVRQRISPNNAKKRFESLRENTLLGRGRLLLPDDPPPNDHDYIESLQTNYESAQYARLVLYDLSISSPIPLLTEEESNIILERIGEWRRFYDDYNKGR